MAQRKSPVVQFENSARFFDVDYFKSLEQSEENFKKNGEIKFQKFFENKYKNEKFSSFVYWMLKNRSSISKEDMYFFLKNSDLKILNNSSGAELQIFNELLKKRLTCEDYVETLEFLESKLVDISFISETDIFKDIFKITEKDINNLTEQEAHNVINKFRERLNTFELLVESFSVENKKNNILNLKNSAKIIDVLVEIKNRFFEIRGAVDNAISDFFGILVDNNSRGIINFNKKVFLSQSGLENYFFERFSDLDFSKKNLYIDYFTVIQLSEIAALLDEKNKIYFNQQLESLLERRNKDGFKWRISNSNLISLVEVLRNHKNGNLCVETLANFIATLALNNSNYEVLAFLKTSNFEDLTDFSKGKVYIGMIEMLGSASNNQNSIDGSIISLKEEALHNLNYENQVLFNLKATSLLQDPQEFIKTSEDLIRDTILNNIKNKLLIVLGKYIRENGRNAFENSRLEQNSKILVNTILSENDLISLYNKHLTLESKWEVEAEISPIQPVYFGELFPSKLGMRLKKEYALNYEKKYLKNKEKNQKEGEDQTEETEGEEIKKTGYKFNLEYYDALFRHFPFKLNNYDILHTNTENILKHFILNQ